MAHNLDFSMNLRVLHLALSVFVCKTGLLKNFQQKRNDRNKHNSAKFRKRHEIAKHFSIFRNIEVSTRKLKLLRMVVLFDIVPRVIKGNCKHTFP